MTPVFLDFETFWSKTHSLSKLQPFEYIMHPETELISCAVKTGKDPTRVYFGDEIAPALHAIDWSKALAVGHNMSGFDAMILAWRLKIIPKMWGCTLAMARPLHAKTVGLSLGALVKHYGIGVKDNTILMATQGRHLADFTPEEIEQMRRYNADDTDQGALLFYKLLPQFSAPELWHIHNSIRILVEPRFELDTGLLETAASVERTQKSKALYDLATQLKLEDMPWGNRGAMVERVRSELASAPKFSQLLKDRGAEVPMKPSPTTSEKMIPALAKNDEAFATLLDHEDPVVATAARVRLQIKSTLTETRIQAFLDAAKITGGRWPVTSHYCGADTTGRRSGWHYNPLNLPRIGKIPKVSDALRRSIRAPKGYKVVVVDLAGIELRFNHFLWKVPYSMALWQAKADADLYRAAAARRFGIALEAVNDVQRQYSKVENLACGFGMGPDKFRTTARIQGGLQLTPEQARQSVYGWREDHPEICRGWIDCHRSLDYIRAGHDHPIDPWGLFRATRGGILTPGGRMIYYPSLRQEPDKEGRPEWVYGERHAATRIYGGKVDENIVQAGARDVLYEMLFDIYRTTGYPYDHEVYDEGIWIVPASEAEDFKRLVEERMRKPPRWWPELITWSKGAVGDCYADAK